QVFRKFSVTLLAITLSEAELLHARELPRFRVPVSIKNGGVNVTIRRFGCWGEHIPPLEKSSPLEIRTDRASKRSDQRRIQRDAPADDRNYVKEQKRADRDTLHTAQIPPFQKGVTNGRGASCIHEDVRWRRLFRHLGVLFPDGGVVEHADKDSSHDGTRLKADLLAGLGVVPIRKGNTAGRFVCKAVSRIEQRHELLFRIA